MVADEIERILRESDTIAVVGCSRHKSKDARRVPAFMQSMGYRIVPINPHTDRLLGERCYPDLVAAHRARTAPIDLVDVFRPARDVPPIADQAVEIGAAALWLQLGIRHEASTRRAREAGLTVVVDRCLRTEYTRRFGRTPRSDWPDEPHTS